MASPRARNNLTLLGSGNTKYPTDYAPQVLEAFDNRHPGRDYLVTLRCPEFTSLCPITSQPDFADITIRYIPDKRLVESKSLKLYLFSFRNHGDFHEDCVNTILADLVKLMSPKYIEVFGEFRPRGGIAIHPLATYGKPRTRYAKLAEERLTRA
ncbi:MAG: preQ(1) synthase [Kiritimatiellia bacterium]